MKKLIYSFILLLIIFAGCNKDEQSPVTAPVDDRVSFEINYLQYSDNNYFIDEIYADTSAELNLYSLYYDSIPSIVITKYIVREIEVYISINQTNQTTNSILANAYINLPARSPSIMYQDSLRFDNNIINGKEEIGRFKLLNKGGDYLFHPETGYITFLFPLAAQDIIAVAYKVKGDDPNAPDGLVYGEFISELVNNSKTRGVLKLVKPQFLKPIYKSAWKLKLKNRYKIEPFIGQVTNLDLDIYLIRADGSETNEINNVRLLKLFGFDKITENGNLDADGKFDNRLGINYDPRTSEIIFPVLQPFGSNIPPALSEYKYQAIYDTIKAFLSLPDNSFVIKGKYKPL